LYRLGINDNTEEAKEKDSDHGRHMKGFNRLKVREPVIEPVVEDVSDSRPGEEEDDLIKEVSSYLPCHWY